MLTHPSISHLPDTLHTLQSTASLSIFSTILTHACLWDSVVSAVCHPGEAFAMSPNWCPEHPRVVIAVQCIVPCENPLPSSSFTNNAGNNHTLIIPGPYAKTWKLALTALPTSGYHLPRPRRILPFELCQLSPDNCYRRDLSLTLHQFFEVIILISYIDIMIYVYSVISYTDTIYSRLLYFDISFSLLLYYSFEVWPGADWD